MSLPKIMSIKVNRTAGFATSSVWGYNVPEETSSSYINGLMKEQDRQKRKKENCDIDIAHYTTQKAILEKDLEEALKNGDEPLAFTIRRRLSFNEKNMAACLKLKEQMMQR